MRTTESRPCPGYAWLLPIVIAFAAGAAGAATHRVEPPALIADALAVAAAGDTVLVACGTYQEQGLVLPDGVTLRGEAGDPACAVIASLGGEPILTCTGVGDQTRIEALTFALSDVGFPAPVVAGGGLHCENAAPQVRDCRFVGLLAGYGGAVFCRDAGPRFTDCDFAGNQAVAAGGAINAVGAGQLDLVGCLLEGNSSAGTGGAVNSANGAVVRFERCTVVGNSGAVGGGLSTWNTGEGSLASSIVALNGGAAWAGDFPSLPHVDCSDLWANGADWSGALADQADLRDNLAEDPVFCGAAVPEQVWGLDISSPCLLPPCGPMGARPLSCDLATGIDDPPPGGELPPQPEVTQLLGNRPNPFNPTTTVSFALRRPGPVRITVYDVAGRAVRRLTDDVWPAGVHEVTWRGDDARGRPAAAGVYFLRLDADGIFDTRRMALVK